MGTYNEVGNPTILATFTVIAALLPLAFPWSDGQPKTAIMARLDQLAPLHGKTADDKARTLIGKLVFATTAVVLLVLVTLGWRDAVIVGAAVIITLAVTLFASWAWGFTINRVSLFALIFSIGILVDDAIVVVENVHRHMAMGAASVREAFPRAVDEVGGPTILATFTVIAALLPLAFVSGLMGPYMSTTWRSSRWPLLYA